MLPRKLACSVGPEATVAAGLQPRRAVLGWLCLLGLAGCAAPQALLPQGDGGVRSLSRTGRFVINVREANGEPQTIQGGFAWLDHAGRLTLDLTSPLGAALARLEVQPDGSAVLTEATGNQTTAPSADALMARVVGVGVPVASLRDWLAGTLTPGVPAEVQGYDSRGRASQFQQAGWQVQASAPDAQGPLRLRLSRWQPGLEIEVRLAMQAVLAP